MRDLLTGRTRNVRLGALLVLAAAALSLGADSGSAALSALHPGARTGFTLSLKAKAVALAPAQTAGVRIRIQRHGLRRRVRFRVVTALPSGVTARFSRVRTRRRRTTLILTADAGAVTGDYRLRIRGRSGHVRRSVTLVLTVVASSAGELGSGPAPALSISGWAPDPLTPGASRPLEVRITNPDALPLDVTGLTVALQAISAPRAGPTLPCGASDFSVVQYSGPPLTVPRSSTRSLSDLGVPAGEWPQVSLIDRPTDQDGCQGATLNLSYRADARLG
jgi:hypothetical protein